MAVPFVDELTGLAFGLIGLVAILVFRPWRWASEWLQDLWDDWDDRRYRSRRSGALRFSSGMIVGLVLGAMLMRLWTAALQHPSADRVAEEVSELASVTRSPAMGSDVTVEVDPSAAWLQVRAPIRTVPEAVDSNVVVEVEAFPTRLNAPEPNPSWQAPVLTSAALEATHGLPDLALATPSNADPAPRLPIRAQVVLALPPDLSQGPAEVLAAIASDQAGPALSSVRSPREAPAPALDLSHIELIQPVMRTPEPAVAEPVLPELFHDVAVAEPVTPALIVPEPAPEPAFTEPEIVVAPEPPVNELAAAERRGEGTTPTEPSTPETAVPGIAETEPIAPLIRPQSRDEVRAAQPLEAEATPRVVQVEALQCNIQRCAAAYQSFRTSDCTYQPYEGPRQLCTR